MHGRRFSSLAVILAITGIAASSSAAPEQARRADDRVDSIGVRTHLGHGDTP